MNKRNWLLIAVISLALVFFWILRRPAPKSDKLRIGVILSTTGQYDLIGKPEKEVLQALVSDYTGHSHIDPNIELVFRDSGGSLEQATKEFDDLASDPAVRAIIGPSTSGESVPIALRADRNQIPLLSLASSRKIVFDDRGNARKWVFKFAQNDDLAAGRLLQAIENDGHKSVALLYSDDGFGKSGADQFRNAIKESDLHLDYESSFSADLNEANPIASGVPSRIQAIVIWGTAPGPALLIKALRRQSHKAQIYLSHGDASVDFVQSAGPAAEGLIIIGSRVLLDRSYLDPANPRDAVILAYQDFWTHHGFRGSPSHFGGHAHDALEALLQALGTGEHNSRLDIRNELETLTNFHGVTGTFNFSDKDHAGLDIQAFATYKINQGTFVPYEGRK
jgi:branched-chain amino acid transport system substrate-binding protein